MAEIAFPLDVNKQKLLELNSVEATIQMSVDVAAKAEEEKKEAERIKREIEEKWSDYNKQFETLTCSGG